MKDELTRALRVMFKTQEVTLPLAFATTLYLDIHHMLRDEVDFGFKRLTDATHFVSGNVKERNSFHKDIHMETWPQENDAAVQQFVDTLEFWCHEDQQQKAAKSMGRFNIPKPFYLYRQHPWSCGLWKYFAQMRFHEISIAFVNAWGAVMSCAHLYNAVECGKTREKMWKDMDVGIGFQDSKTIFVGEAPSAAEVDVCFKRYILAMGGSAANLAKSTRKKKGLILSKEGAEGFERAWPHPANLQRSVLQRERAERPPCRGHPEDLGAAKLGI